MPAPPTGVSECAVLPPLLVAPRRVQALAAVVAKARAAAVAAAVGVGGTSAAPTSGAASGRLGQLPAPPSAHVPPVTPSPTSDSQRRCRLRAWRPPSLVSWLLGWLRWRRALP